jgi:hypothetical protein
MISFNKEALHMNDNEKKTAGGGMFLINDVSLQEIFTPEDFTIEHTDIGKAAEDFIKGEILSRGEEIETLNYELLRELMRKCGELGFLA